MTSSYRLQVYVNQFGGISRTPFFNRDINIPVVSLVNIDIEAHNILFKAIYSRMSDPRKEPKAEFDRELSLLYYKYILKILLETNRDSKSSQNLSFLFIGVICRRLL